MPTRSNPGFLRSIATLAGATTAAQLLPLLAAPILTRVYLPADVGEAGLFLAVASMLSVVATLRYSKAIVVPEDEEEARALLSLSLRLALGLGLALGLAGAAIGLVVPAFAATVPWTWLALLPLSCALLAAYDSLHGWTVRTRAFRRLARSRVLLWGTVVVVQLVLPLFTPADGTTLAIGLVLGQLAGVLVLVPPALSALVGGPRPLRAVALQHRAFPSYSLPADTVNVVSGQAPILLFAALFSPVVVGLYNLAHRVLVAPVTIVAGATSDVFRERAARDFGSTGSCRPLFVRTSLSLLGLAVLPFLAIGLAGPSLFAWVFGEEWRAAGQFAQLLAPLFAVRVAVSPVSYVLYIAGRQRVDLVWQVVLLVGIAAGILAGAHLGGARLAVLAFAVVYTTMYLVYWLVCYRATVNPVRPAPPPGTPRFSP